MLAGPTGSGKTALALKMAKEAGAEIVGADSQQVYRGFDIGTAKPTAAELAQVPHHLISVVDPWTPFSAVKYQALADEVIANVHARGRPVLLVGGTGLYLRILLHGVVAAAGADPALRARLSADANAFGSAALHARLAAVDPRSASRLPVSDRLRVIRALEIHQRTGKPASQWRDEHTFAQERYSFALFVLDPPRDALYEAINQRTRALFDAGLVEETRALVAAGYRETSPMRCVGYRQALAVIDGTVSREDAILSTAQQTRHYAKRQLTWFRREQKAQLIRPPYTEIRMA